MKKEAYKPRKPRRSAGRKISKAVCGTLLYLEECRGAQRKTDTVRWAAPPDSIDIMVRK